MNDGDTETPRWFIASGIGGVVFVAIIVAGIVIGSLWSGSDRPPPEDPREDQTWSSSTSPRAERPPGWSLRIESNIDQAVERVVEGVRAATASFALEPDETLHPLAPLEFRAIYTSVLEIEERGRYAFNVEAQGGSATFVIEDAGGVMATLESDRLAAAGPAGSLELEVGEYLLIVTFRRDGVSRARLRTTWSRAGDDAFPPQAVPTRVVRVDPRSPTTASDAELLGRKLIEKSGCVGCHAVDPSIAGKALAELPAPKLGHVGRFFTAAWLEQWIRDPQVWKPGSGMPDSFDDGDDDIDDATAITHFLLSLEGIVPSEAISTEPSVLAQGRRLYHSVGCVPCHGALDAPGIVFEGEGLATTLAGASVPVPFGNLATKWKASGLSEFLRDPVKTHPAGTMPSLNLSGSEADLIAGYLCYHFDTDTAPSPTFTIDLELVERGKAAFQSRGCISCHRLQRFLPDAVVANVAKPLAELTAGRGCLDPDDEDTPRYTFFGEERSAIAAALTTIRTLTERRRSGAKAATAPLDAAARTYEAYGCGGCHGRDGAGGITGALGTWCRVQEEVELGDEGRIPPDLSDVGFKLTTRGLRNILVGDERARPYMSTRMPKFQGARVAELIEQLSKADGIWPESETGEPDALDDLVLAGRKLVGTDGMSCISCHAFGDYPSAGVPGPNMTAFAERIRFEWWDAFAKAPHHVKPGTRMPGFFEGGASAFDEILEGDADRQIEALWAYCTLGEFMPVPEGIVTGNSLQLQVGDRPRVFRCFLKSAGSRGVAVGFPIGLHFAFDAERLRLVEAWQGDFVNAGGSWAGRGGNVVGGQGETVWRAPAGAALVFGERPASWPRTANADRARSRGYRLDGTGVPSFLREQVVGESTVKIMERFAPHPAPGRLLDREFEVAGLPAGSELWFNAGRGDVRVESSQNVEVEESIVNEELWLRLLVGSGSLSAKWKVSIEP